MLKNLSVGERLGLGFGIIGILFAVVVLQYHQALFGVMERFDSLQDNQAAKKNHFLNVHRYMLEARRSEKDFLVRKKLQYPKRVEKYVQLIKEEALRIQELEKKSGDDSTGNQIHQLIQTYHDAFEKIVAAWKINGLDHNSGLQGRFRDTIHKVEAQAKNFKTSRLTLILLQIRRAEKDLGLRQQRQYLYKVRDLIMEFFHQINQSSLDDHFKKQLARSMELYRTSFETYAKKVLSGNLVNGGKGPFRDSAHKLEKQLAAHYVPNLEEEILTLRRREKDYLLRGKQSYVETVQQTVTMIKNNIIASDIPDADKQSLKEEIQRYNDDFLALVEHNNEITRLTALMRESVHKIEPIIAMGVAEASNAMAATTDITRIQAQNRAAFAIFIAITAIALGIGFAVYFSRSITHPVNTLTQLAELFAPPEQDDAARNPPSKDEILTLTNAMGRMTGHLQDIIYYFTDHIGEIKSMTATLEESADKSLSTAEKQRMIASLQKMSTDLEKKMRQLDV